MDDRAAGDGAAFGGSHSVGHNSAQTEPHSFRRRLGNCLRAPLRWARAARSRPGLLLRLAFLLLVLGVGIWIVARQAYGWHQLVAGKHDLQADHCRDALDHFRASLEIWPEDPTTLFLAARAARRVGDFEAAERYLTKCQASSSMAEPAAFERVLLRATRGEIDAVGGFCQVLLDQGHPDTPLILEALALGELTQLRFKTAEIYLDLWLAKSPDQAQAVFLKGRLQLQASNSQEALGLLRRAVELDPERDDARLLLAGLYLDLGQAREALPHLEEARRRLPHNLFAQTRMAQCLVLLGRPEEAISLLDGVLRQNPDVPSALLERGKLAFRDGELEKAEAWLRKACKRDPGNRAAHYQLLQCLKQEGKVAEFRAVQQRLDQIDQDSTRMREIVTELLPKRRNDPDLHAELGELFLSVGAVPEGVSWLDRALQLEPRNPRAHRALAQHYYSLGQSGKAQQHRDLGGVLDPAPITPK